MVLITPKPKRRSKKEDKKEDGEKGAPPMVMSVGEIEALHSSS